MGTPPDRQTRFTAAAPRPPSSPRRRPAATVSAGVIAVFVVAVLIVIGATGPARVHTVRVAHAQSPAAPSLPAAPPAGGNAGAATPNGGATPAPSSANLDRLRAEHAAIKDALFRSRARRDTLENALLSTQLLTTIAWEGGRRHALKAAEVRLDGVRLWTAADAPPGDRPVVLAARGVSAGTHVLGVRVEVRARDNPKLGYVSEQTFTVVLPEGKKTGVEITIDESGDLPGYNPEVEVEISPR